MNRHNTDHSMQHPFIINPKKRKYGIGGNSSDNDNEDSLSLPDMPHKKKYCVFFLTNFFTFVFVLSVRYMYNVVCFVCLGEKP